MMQEPRYEGLIPDFLSGAVNGMVPKTFMQQMFPCSHATGTYNGSWHAQSVSLQVIR